MRHLNIFISLIKHENLCFVTFSNTEIRRVAWYSLTKFEMFANVSKYCFQCYYKLKTQWKQVDWNRHGDDFSILMNYWGIWESVCIAIGHLHDPVTWYGINYAETQVIQWDFKNKGTRTSPARRSFVLNVRLRYLRPSIIYSILCEQILSRWYSSCWKWTRTSLYWRLMQRNKLYYLRS